MNSLKIDDRHQHYDDDQKIYLRLGSAHNPLFHLLFVLLITLLIGRGLLMIRADSAVVSRKMRKVQ